MPSKTPIPVDVVDRLTKSMLVLSRTIGQILESRAVEAAVDESLSTSMVQVLRLLGNRGGQTSSQAARHLGVSRPAVSQIIDAMVGMRLVVRRSTERDRREVVLELTKRGRQRFQAVRKQQRHLLRNAIRTSKNVNAEKWIDTLQEIAGAVARADRNFEQYCLQCGAHSDGTCILIGGDAACPFMVSREASSKPKTTRRSRK